MRRTGVFSLFAAVLAVILIACNTVSAEIYATHGDASGSVTFYAMSQGNASITFRQSEGLCTELSYTHLIDGITGREEEWGKYHIYVTSPLGNQYTEEWDKTFNGGSFSIDLPYSGTYTIRVVPYSAYEMTASWTLDRFVCWETYPRWSISKQTRCSCTEKVWCDVQVKQVDYDTGKVLSQRTERLYSDKNTVNAGSTPRGYTLVGKASYSVTVSVSGVASLDPVVFEYKKSSTPTPAQNTQQTQTATYTQTQETTYNQGVTQQIGREYDMGTPWIGGTSYSKNQSNMVIFWVQTQMKATNRWYQGNEWDVTGTLGDHTMSEIRSFMSSKGYSNHSGRVDQQVIDELAAYLGYYVEPVYVGGFYSAMDSIMNGGSSGSMKRVDSSSSANAVRWVQICLKHLGYYSGSIHGRFDSDTTWAIRRFQRDHGYMQRDYVTLGVARAILEAYYAAGGNLNSLP